MKYKKSNAQLKKMREIIRQKVKLNRLTVNRVWGISIFDKTITNLRGFL